MKDLKRLKEVLAEKKNTNKWLAEQLDLQTLDKIASLLETAVKNLINSTREDVMYIPVPRLT